MNVELWNQKTLKHDGRTTNSVLSFLGSMFNGDVSSLNH